MQQGCKLRRFELRISRRRMSLHSGKDKCRTELCDILHRHRLRNVQAESKRLKRLNIFVKSRVFPAFLFFRNMSGLSAPNPGHKGLFVSNCQVKCNNLLKKTSSGDFQPRHLRGRLFKREAIRSTSSCVTSAKEVRFGKN